MAQPIAANLLHRTCSHVDFSRVFVAHNLDEVLSVGDAVHIVAEKNYSMAMLAHLQISHYDDTADVFEAELVRGVEATPLLDHLKNLYWLINVNEATGAWMHSYTIRWDVGSQNQLVAKIDATSGRPVFEFFDTPPDLKVPARRIHKQVKHARAHVAHARYRIYRSVQYFVRPT